MKDTKKEIIRRLNGGAVLSGVGFLLYLAARALGWGLAADVICIVFGIIAVLTFLCAASERRKDKEAVYHAVVMVPLSFAVCSLEEIHQMCDELFEINKDFLGDYR